jgi:hypothetical protein
MGDFWAYENWRAHGHRLTIHRGECGACHHGAGVHGGGQTPNGTWHGPFRSADEARSAVTSGSVEVRDCARCAP